jgi:hypothetical protein
MFKKKYFTLDMVKEVLRLHPSDCVLELNAPERILERLSVKSINEWMPIFCTDAQHQAFKDAWQLSEIYCPHENIDRRQEYGIS